MVQAKVYALCSRKYDILRVNALYPHGILNHLGWDAKAKVPKSTSILKMVQFIPIFVSFGKTVAQLGRYESYVYPLMAQRYDTNAAATLNLQKLSIHCVRWNVIIIDTFQLEM